MMISFFKETPQLKQQTQQRKKMHQMLSPARVTASQNISMPPNVAELQASEKVCVCVCVCSIDV